MNFNGSFTVFSQILFSDLESRKETLEADLESAVKNFELSQQELIEIRVIKESVEAELCRAAEELVCDSAVLYNAMCRFRTLTWACWFAEVCYLPFGKDRAPLAGGDLPTLRTSIH